MTPQQLCPSRRTVLKGIGAGLAAPLLSTRLAFADTAVPYAGDVLVVLSLRGGFDGLAAVAPVGDPGYAQARPSLAVPAAAGLQLDSTFALHPALAMLKPLWDAGTFGVVHAVGQPDGSRSHFKATEELERAAPGTSLRTGWLDRVLGDRGTGAPLQAVTVGDPTSHLALSGPAPDVSMRGLPDFTLEGARELRGRMTASLAAMHAGTDGPAAATLRAIEAAEAVAAAPRGPGYPDAPLGRALADVARLVKADAGLQVACVDYGDWDMHSGLGTVDGGRMVDQLRVLGGALAAFAADLGPALGRVTVVTMSEFGRRVAENGSAGTDHGHANAVLMLGGGVVGGKVHGRWPGLAPAQLDRGDLAGTSDYRDVLGEVLQKRCGVGSLAPVFPGLSPAPLGVVRAA